MEDDRLNSPSTSAISFEVMGHHLLFSQDPNSKHLGTTLWDASMVFVKFLEKNCRKGQFSAEKLQGKRVIELGAGCGLAGFGMAILGCDVVSTDQVEVLPLLMRNVERNISRITQGTTEVPFGSIEVAQLDWGNEDHIAAVGPPFDFIIGTDIVYSEHLLEPLMMTLLALSGPRTTILLGYELRSTVVHENMMKLWKEIFEVKQVSRRKMDCAFQHSSIQLFIMKPKCQLSETVHADAVVIMPRGITNEEEAKDQAALDRRQRLKQKACVNDHNSVEAAGEAVAIVANSMPLAEWEVRRSGAVAAALLQNVKIE